MQKYLFILMFSISIGTLHTTPWDWLSKGVSENNLLLNLALENIVQKIDGIPFKDPVKFNTYKLRLSELQRTMKAETELLGKKPDPVAMKKAQEILKKLREEENKLLAEAKTAMDPEDFSRLKTSIDNRLTLIKNELTLANVADKLVGAWHKFATPRFKEQLSAQNPYAKSVAHVRKDAKLSYQEEIFRARRFPWIQQGLSQFLNEPIAKPITIGFVGSGGGYRAMILTVGCLKAFEDLGLLNATMYMTALSGSAWFLVPWISLGGTIQSFKEKLLEKIKNNSFDIQEVQGLLKTDVAAMVNDIFWPKFLFDQPLGSIDVYGALLAKSLLADFGKDVHKQHLSEQWFSIQDGNKPFPMYTAISMHKEHDAYLYNWYEFNPLEVRNLEHDLYIPAYSFNSVFENGISKEIAPEQSLGFLMGIFGSAYAVNFKDIDTMLFSAIHDQEKQQTAFEKVKYIISSEIIAVMHGSPLGKVRASPAQINNPFRGTIFAIPDWLKNRELITMIDAGIHYNIPGRPLLRPARDVDVMIIADSSSNADQAKELTLFFQDARRFYGYEYVRVGDVANRTLHFYKDPKNNKAPRIIYMNFNNDRQLMQKAENNPALLALIDQYNLTGFSMEHCLRAFCNTFNFKYTVNEFLQLSGMSEFTVKAHQEAIRQFIKDEFYKKRMPEEFEFGF